MVDTQRKRMALVSHEMKRPSASPTSSIYPFYFGRFPTHKRVLHQDLITDF